MDPFVEWGLAQTKVCNEYLTWAKNHDNLKIVKTDIPDRFFPSNVRQVALHDVRVFSKNRVPDDKLYNKSKQLREKVARGNCLLSMTVKIDSTVHAITCFLVFALKKFTGGMGDDDDEDDPDKETWKTFFSQPIENTAMVVSTVKENGAAAHLAAFKLFGKHYIITGSKNVHLLFQNNDDDLAGFNDQRFMVAKIVGHATNNLLATLGEEKKTKLLDYLSESHLTACFELIDPNDQHVELISLNQPELRFIAFTTFEERDRSYCRDPQIGFDKMESFGVVTVQHETIEIDKQSSLPVEEQLADHFAAIRRMRGTEGRVIYFLDKDRNVIGLLKKKSMWYIILRAIREKLKSYSMHKPSGSEANNYGPIHEALNAKLNKRLKEIQKWLEFSQKTYQEWSELAGKANDWVYSQLKSGNLNGNDLGNQFPVVWNAFLQSTGSTDDIEFEGPS